jgi:hypothetical protein
MATKFGIRNYSRSGNNVTFTVIALNPDGTVDTNYTGAVNFAGGGTTFPQSYTFTAADQGQRVFTATIFAPNDFASVVAQFPNNFEGNAVLGIAGTAGEADVSTGVDGHHTWVGNVGNDRFTSGNGNDLFRLEQGGVDSASGMGGNDAFYFGAAYTAADIVSGGEGRDQVALQGDYPSLTLGSLTSIQDLFVLSGSDTRFGNPGGNTYDYVINSIDANVAAGERLTVDATQLLAGESLTFNGSAETNGAFTMSGGRGTDVFTGGAGNDGFYFRDGSFWNAGDRVTGGGGIDQLGFRGDFTGANAVVMGASQITGISALVLMSGLDTRFGPVVAPTKFDITMDNGNVTAGATFTVDGAQLAANETARVDASAETDGNYRLFGGAAADTLIAGAGADLVSGSGGADTLTGNGGTDSFRYSATADSTAAAMDRILDFTPGTDKIDLTRIDANSHAAGNQAFSWIGSNTFTGSGAASAGELRAYENGGKWFVEGDTDGNGVGDLVVELTLQGATPLGQGDFFL